MLSWLEELLDSYLQQLISRAFYIMPYPGNSTSQRGQMFRIARRLYQYVYLPGLETPR